MKNTKKDKRFNWGKLILWISLSLLLIIAGSATFLFFNTERIITNNLSNFVYEKTDSIYRLKFESLKIDILNKDISANNILFEPDASIPKDSLKSNYYFKTHYLSITEIKLWPLIRDRRLVAQSFKIEKPEFEFGKDKQVDLNFLSKYHLNKGDTLHIPIFAEVFFDTLSVLNAQLNIDTIFQVKQELPAINLVANHFKLGGKKFTDTPYPFDVSDLSLTIENLNEKLPDHIHQVSVKSIHVSLLHSLITAKSAVLSPISDTIATDENRYRINVPEIKIKGDNISELNQFDTLRFQSVEFNDPTIQIKFGNKVKKGTPLNEINFYDLTGNTLKWIKINKFSFVNADVKLKPSKSNEVAQHFDRLFVNFYDFLIDSTSYKNPDRILSAKEMNFRLSRYELNHTDKVHQLVINNLKVDTRTKKITSDQLSFEPISQNYNKINTIIHVNSKGFTCYGVKFLQFYHNQKLPMTKLSIRKPSIQIDFEQKRTLKKNIKDKSIILDKISDYLTGIYVDTTKITDGDVSYTYSTLQKNEGFFKSNFNIELVNLSVDSTTFAQSDKIFFADNFKIHFGNLKLQLADETHRLLSKTIDMSSKEKSAEITDLHILPIKEVTASDSIHYKNKSEFFDIRFPKIKMSGANLHRAFFDNRLYINSIYMTSPTFNIEKFGDWKNNNVAKTPYQNALYAMVSDFLFSINIRHVSMDNGVLNIVQHKQNQRDFELSNQFSIKMTNFDLDANSSSKENKLFFSDDIDLILKNHSFTLADGVHKVDADEIGILSSQKRIYINNAKLYPDILSKKFHELPVSVFANIPNIQITNADIFGLLNKGHFPVNTVTLNEPDIKILFQKNLQAGTDNKEKKALFLLNDLKSISANHITINNGKLELAEYKNQKSNPLAHTNVNFKLDGFSVVHRNNKFETSYSDFTLNLSNWIYHLPDEIHTLQVQRANYHLADKQLDIFGLEIKPLSTIQKTSRKLFVNLTIPAIHLSQFNFKDYVDTKKLKFDQLQLNQPNLTLEDKRIEKSKKFSLYQLDLYPQIKSFSNALRINDIEVKRGQLHLRKDKSLELNNITLNAIGFNIDKLNTQQGKLLNSDFVALNLKNIKGKTKGDYFEYKINTISLNTQGDFQIEGISLKPIYSAEEFARRKVYQADYFTIDNADLSGTGLNVQELVENQNLYANVLNGKFNSVKIHRDKSYPLTPDLRTKLPQEALRDLKIGLNIDKATLSVNHFQFSEIEENSVQKSQVFVTDLSAELSNISNVREKLTINPIMKARIHGNLMGVGDVLVKMDMNVPSFGNEFTFNATCGTMPLSALNPIAEPGLKLSIKEGMNKKMEVYFEANEDSAVGNIRFAYNDLKISVLNARDGQLKEGKFISFLVNSIALKSDNPKPGRLLLPAKFVNHRDKQRSVVGYCWKSIYSGIKSTLGLKEK